MNSNISTSKTIDNNISIADSSFGNNQTASTSSDLINEFIFDASFFAELFDSKNKDKNKILLDEIGICWNNEGKLIIHDLKFYSGKRIDYFVNTSWTMFFTKMYRVLGNKSDKINSKDLAELVMIEYCQKNSIDYIYEPLVLDNKFFVNLFDINNIENNKDLLDVLGRKRNKKGEFLINDIYFDYDSKRLISSLDNLGFPIFYKHLAGIGKAGLRPQSKEAVLSILANYCEENNIKYIYKQPTKLDKDFFANLFDIKNKEENGELFQELGLSWTDELNLDLNRFNFVIGKMQSLGINIRTLYDNLDRINGNDNPNNSSRKKAIDVLIKYCNQNNIKFCYTDPLIFDKEFFANLLNLDKIEENKTIIDGLGRKRNEKGEFIINSAIYSQAHKIESLGSIGKKIFYTYIFDLLKNSSRINHGIRGHIDSQISIFDTLIQYCRENNIKYIYEEPINFDDNFFADLFDIKSKEKNKTLADQLGLTWDDEGYLDINKINFASADKVSVGNSVSQKWFYTNIYRILGDDNSYVTSVETFRDAIIKYCQSKKIKYIYEESNSFDKDYFGSLLDIKNHEDNKESLSELSWLRNDNGELLINQIKCSQRYKISTLDLGYKTFYTYIYKLLEDKKNIDVRKNNYKQEVISNYSAQKTLEQYCIENNVKYIYNEPKVFGKEYFDSILDIKNKKYNEKLFVELGWKVVDGMLNLDDLIFDKTSKIISFESLGFDPFYNRIYRLLGYSDIKVTGKLSAQKIVKEYCNSLGLECNFSEPVAFDKGYFDELFGFNNIDVNRGLFADFGRNWTNGVLDITNTKFRHEAKIKNLDGLVFSVFFTHLYKLLNNKDGIKTAINGYISGYDSAIKILLQYFAENNIKYIYKEQYKFDNSFFKKFFNFGNKADNNLAFDQIGRKWLDDGSLDITNLNHKTNAKILALEDVGHVSFYSNIYRQLSDNGDIQVGKSGYIENKGAAKNTLKRYCKENGIICIDDGFRAEFDDKYFCDILNIANIYKNDKLIKELGRKRNEKGEFDISVEYYDSKKLNSLDMTMRTFYSKIYRLLGNKGKVSNSPTAISSLIEYCKKFDIPHFYEKELIFDKDYFLNLLNFDNKNANSELFDILGIKWSNNKSLDISNLKYIKENKIIELGIQQSTFYTKIYNYLNKKDHIKTNGSSYITSMDSSKKTLMTFCEENGILCEGFDDGSETISDILNGKTIKEYISLAKTVGRKPIIEILMTQYKSFAGLGIEKVEKILGKFLGDSRSVDKEGLLDDVSHETLDIVLESSEINESIYKSIQNEFVKYIVKWNKENGYISPDYPKLYKEWRKEFVTKTQKLQSQISQIMYDVDKYRNDVINHENIANLKVNLGGNQNRKFPGIEQWINIISLSEQKRLLVADDMGLGKTGSAIGSVEFLKSKGKIKNALVICPANMISTWTERLHDGELGYFVNGRSPKVLVLDNKSKMSENFENYDYVIVSSARLNESNVSEILNQKYDMMVVDEIHEMKNTTSGVRSQNLIKLSDKLPDDGYLLALSGTPIPNKIKDISIVMRLLYTCEFSYVSDQDLVKNIVNQDKLSIGIKYRNKTNRKKLTDWIDMPEKTEKNIYIKASAIEKEIAKIIIEDNELRYSQKLILLRKLYMCIQSLNPELGAGSKMIAVADEIISQFETKNKIYIILNDYIEDMIRSEEMTKEEGDEMVKSEGYVIDYIKSRLKDKNIYDVEYISYHGNIDSKARDKIQSDFAKNDNKKKLLFVSGNATRVGIDFSSAEGVLVYNQPWTLSDMYQQEARVYRVGLDHPIDICRFVVEDTLESGIYTYTHSKHRAIEKMVENKELMTDAEIELILSDNIDENKYHADSDFSYYYSNEKSLLYDMFAINKGVGEERFVANMSRMIDAKANGFDKYADIYNMLGKRNYQANANRINSQIISLISRKNNISNPKILDLACGNQLLSKVMPEEIQDSIISIDINPKYMDNAFDRTVVDKNYKEAIGAIYQGSMTNTYLVSGSQDFVNLSLAYHYTGLSANGNKYDRIRSLSEINRVLKIGGICIINEIYSLDFADRDYLQKALTIMGFVIVDKFSGKAESVDIKNYSSNILTIKKITNSEKLTNILSDEDKKRDIFRGLKFRYNKDNIHSQSFMIDKFEINDDICHIELNQSDKNLKNEESKTTSIIDSMKDIYGNSLSIPENVLHANGFFSYYDKNKKGKKIRRIARKLSDGSYVFVS